MRRREFIGILSGATASLGMSLPLAAQEAGRIYRIGFLSGGLRQASHIIAFFEELRRSGFNDGQNLAIVAGGFGLRDEQFAEAAVALVESAPDAIVSTGPVATRAAQAATKTIAILASSDDMVGDGLVPSLRRPGGNTTGVSLLAPELDGKRQDILIEAVPGIQRIAALADPNVATTEHLQVLRDRARAHGVELSVVFARIPEEIAPAMSAASAAGAQALNVLATPLFFFNRHTVIVRAAALRLPAMYQWPEMAEDGGFAGYGPRITQWYRELARLLAKVLRGAKPNDLPVEQPTRFELVINLETAKAVGREIPTGLIARADKVIE
jgi:putative tryptophan/tyrosine transport system substrate-binding protein